MNVPSTSLRRAALLGALLLPAGLPTGSPATVPGGGGAGLGRQQVFRLAGGQLASTRAG
jgi:hypothetical protein